VTDRAITRNNKLIGPPVGAAVLIGTFALNILALALPLVVLQIFDRVIPFESTSTLFFLFVGLCLVSILEFTLKTARAALLGSTGEAFEAKLSEHFINATLKSEPEKFSQTTPAAHLDQFGAIAQLRGYYAGQGRILAIDLPFTAVFVAMIGLIGGWLVLVPLGCIVALLLFRVSLQSAQSSIFEKRRTLDSRRYSFLAEAVSQIKTLKANTMEPQILRRYELLQQQTTDISYRIIKFSGLSQSFGALFSQLAVAAMGLFGSYLVVTKQIGIAELAACMLLNGRSVQPMLKALGLWVQSENIAAAKTKFEKACAFEQMPKLPNRSAELSGGIEFKNVSFASEESDAPLLQNVNICVATGEALLLSGKVGEAKKSLLKLILGEVSPTTGRVLIDTKPAREYLTSRGPNGICYVDHKPVIFAGTVLDNISAFGDGERIELALRLSSLFGVEKYIQRLPLGYNTQVLNSPILKNNRAVMQGISLVRALALQPKILLLNNIGAAMDNNGKSALVAFAKNHEKTPTLVVAEDTNCFAGIADQILNLDHSEDALVRAWQADALADQEIPEFDRIENRSAAA
jgi:ATP-binding cassette subfamily C protein LapB